MKKTVNIEGMHCKHCAAAVKEQLEKVNGVKSVKVDLNKKCAVLSCESEIKENDVIAAISEAGFEFKSMEDKKGLF